MKKIYNSRVIIQHKPGCFMKGKEVPWSGIPAGTFWSNYAANPKQSGHHCWIKVSCNDPSCPAIKAVHVNTLANA